MLPSYRITFKSEIPSYRGGFPDGSEVETLPALKEIEEMWVWFLGQEDPWRRQWQPTPVSLPEKLHGQRSLEMYSPYSCNEADKTEHTQAHSYRDPNRIICCQYKSSWSWLQNKASSSITVYKYVLTGEVATMYGSSIEGRLCTPWRRVVQVGVAVRRSAQGPKDDQLRWLAHRGTCSPTLSPVTIISCVNNNDSPATRSHVSGIYSSV